MDRKVWLPSGGTLVIDRTEAMTVVDVNTGKFTGAGGNLEQTVTKNNLEAAEEVVRSCGCATSAASWSSTSSTWCSSRTAIWCCAG
jgi:ribonuclease E